MGWLIRLLEALLRTIKVHRPRQLRASIHRLRIIIKGEVIMKYLGILTWKKSVSSGVEKQHLSVKVDGVSLVDTDLGADVENFELLVDGGVTVDVELTAHNKFFASEPAKFGFTTEVLEKPAAPTELDFKVTSVQE